MTTPDGDWAALCGSLPSHDDAVMDGYHPVPSIAQQDATHGAGTPALDLGPAPGTVSA